MRAAYEYVQDSGRAPTAPVVIRALRDRFVVTEPQVRAALKKLVNLGWLSKDRRSGVYRVLQPELLPAHLFLTVPERNWPRVAKFIRKLGRRVEQRNVDAVQMRCDLLLNLGVFDRDSLFLLCDEARRNGADEASALLEKTATQLEEVA